MVMQAESKQKHAKEINRHRDGFPESEGIRRFVKNNRTIAEYVQREQLVWCRQVQKMTDKILSK